MKLLVPGNPLGACLVLLLAACTSYSGVSPLSSSPTASSTHSGRLSPLPTASFVPKRGGASFQLHILKRDWEELQLGYEREHCWAVLKRTDLRDSYLVITEDDVENYDWREQLIKLTPEAWTRLSKILGKGDYPLSISMTQRVFVVTFSDARLYGGIFLEMASAIGVDFPVIYLEPDGDQHVFMVRPRAGWWIYKDLGPADKSVIEIKELHDFFLQQSKLTE